MVFCVAHMNGNAAGRRKEEVIYLGPGVGFGSGRHPTTHMCLVLLEDLFAEHSPSTVLDAGTGTGILAIAAAKLGADRVLGIEIDLDVAKTARKNVLMNRTENKVHIMSGDIQQLSRSFDAIMANLCPDQIAQTAKFLENHLAEDGDFILSGLRGFEKEHVLKALMEHRGLTLVEDLWEEGWSAVWMHKPV
jgi:ribosomal protein L11 methyltransferase